VSTIPFGSPILGEEEIDAARQVLSGTQLVHGPRAADFERRFAERAGATHGITASSCTAALHLSLLALGVGPGDSVIVPAMTHVATAHAVEHCGARPVFADADPATGNIDPDAVAAAIDATTKAVMVVHYLGLPCDMDRITAAAPGLPIVEDCATAVDATYDGRTVGTIGVTGCFSFYPAKHITTSEGGMLITMDDAIAATVRHRKAFGYDKMLGERTRPGVYDVTALGFNYRMSELHAAIGLVQLDRLDAFQSARAANFAALTAGLGEIDGVVVFPGVHGKATSSHYCLNIVLPRDGSIPRDAVVNHLTAEGIGTSVHYPGAVPLFAYYRERYDHRPGAFPVAEWIGDQTISLPVGPHLGPSDPARIAAAVREGVERARKEASP
jgi:perosamine synthetase